ncbi:MAG: LacI family transcriptional regulator [Oscillospiraceae bacterium]|jgi:LacI family transcriptional regulator|nr:LacI family transcriptional regulator [Oscillospiraceae bacterium]
MKSIDPNKRVTLKDIAERTGFTANTVSRALKDCADISSETKALIRETAQKLGYVRNSMASALRSGKSNTIALIVGAVGNPKFAMMADDLIRAANAKQYNVILLYTYDDPALEAKAIQTAVERRVDGIIITTQQKDDHSVMQLRLSRIPFVLIERHFKEYKTDAALCDEEQGGYLAARHLLDAGHTRIAFLTGEAHISSSRERAAGFLRAVGALPESSYVVIPMSGDGAENARSIVQLGERGFTGYFFYHDMGLLDTLNQLGKIAPQLIHEYGYIGFDNIERNLSLPAPICSVDSSSVLVCQAAVDLLVQRINGEQFSPQSLVFPTSVVCRGSCGRHSERLE